jgi:2-dehydropantoate 2-reductase
MRITVLGAGAMGCLFAALLADVAEVTVLARSVEAVMAIRGQRGVRLVEIEGERSVHGVMATRDPERVPPADLALVLVKAQGTAWAGQMAARVLAPPGGLALTLQNGLGNREVLIETLGASRVWQGVTAQGATLLGQGRVYHAGRGPTHLETRPEIAGLAESVSGLFRQAGLETYLAPDVTGLAWGKLVINASINALTALLRVPNGVLADEPAAQRVMVGVVTEAVQVAQAKGITLPYADAMAQVLAVCRATAANHSSMLQDVIRGRPTEVAMINGAIVTAAHSAGLAAPANQMLVDLIEAIEATAARRIPLKERESYEYESQQTRGRNYAVGSRSG